MVRNRNAIYVLAITNFSAITLCVYYLLIECEPILRETLTLILSAAIFWGNIYGEKHIREVKKNLSKNLNLQVLTTQNLNERKELQITYFLLYCPHVFMVFINWYAAIFLVSLGIADAPKTVIDVFSISDAFFLLWDTNIFFAFTMTFAAVVIALIPRIIRSFLEVNNE